MKRLALALALLAPSGAAAETLLVSLSTHRVSITSNYTGAQLAIFAVIERDAATVARANSYDVIITVRGPKENVIVSEKRQTFGVWVNQRQRYLAGVPSFLTILSSRPLQEIVDPQRAQRLNFGLLPIITSVVDPTDMRASSAEFRASLVRLRFESGLYAERERGVTFLTSSVFQAPISLPAAAPTGNYEVEVNLLADGTPLAKQTTNFEVVKAGFEQFIADAARQRPWSYGFVAAALSVLFGWLSSIAFRRD